MSRDDDPFGALAHQLRSTPPHALRALDAGALEDLAGAVQTARRRQASELAAAGDQAFGHIPRLLRGPIKKLVGA